VCGIKHTRHGHYNRSLPLGKESACQHQSFRIPVGNGIGNKRHHERRACFGCNLDNVGCPVIHDVTCGSDGLAIVRNDGQADQIGVVEFALFERREGVARNGEHGSAQRFGSGPIGDFGWTYQHDQGRKAVEAEYGDKVETSYLESVPEGPDAERALRQMEAAKLLDRQSGTEDRRTRQVTLTRKGRKALETGTPIARGNNAKLAETLTAEEAALLKDLLDRFEETISAGTIYEQRSLLREVVERIELGPKKHEKGKPWERDVVISLRVASPTGVNMVTPRGHTPYGEKCSSGLIPIKESRGLRSLHKGLRLAG